MTDHAYTRISLDRETSGSIDKQRSQLAAHSVNPVWYEDRSVSGAIPFAERPGGARLMANLKSGDRVLASKIDRVARNVQDLLHLVEFIQETGASIHFVEQNIDTGGPIGKFMLTLLGAVAEFERELIKERRLESLARFREEGRHAVGAAPFGLQSVPSPNGRGLVLRPHPEEAPRLRAVTARVLAGEITQEEAASQLGIWKSHYSRLLRNERLAGIIGVEASGSPRFDLEQAVFDLAEWDAIKQHIDRPEKAWSKHDGFGAVLVCGSCGNRLYYQRSSRGHHTYTCSRALHGKGGPAEGLTGVSIMVHAADSAIERDVLTRFGHLPVTEEVRVASSAARTKAIALARMRMDNAKRLADAAQTDEAEDEALAGYRAAKRGLRAAEAMPEETVTELRDTGETYAQVWERSTPAERTELASRLGRWVVRAGRGLSPEEKVALEPGAEYFESRGLDCLGSAAVLWPDDTNLGVG